MTKLVVGFGNRSFFPPKYMAQAREEIPAILASMGHEVMMMPAEATNLGAVQTREEGRKFASWLESKVGEYDGIVWTHPNFGDESGMLPALQAAGKRGDKIFLHAYPDKMDQMGPDERRDAFCGKVSTMDVLHQYGIPFIALTPHVVSPSSPRFKKNIDLFAIICAGTDNDRYVPLAPETTMEGKNMLDGITLLALGARTTPFFTTRYNELDAAKHGITIETADLSLVFDKMDKIIKSDERYKQKAAELKVYTDWSKASPNAFDQQVRLAVVLDEYIAEYNPAAIGVRCWTEFQQLRKISPCATISNLNNKGIPTACEVDLGNALMMYIMQQCGSDAVACQDWNNNFKEGHLYDDLLMFMHCGPHDTKWLKQGHYADTHGILDHDFGEGNGMGCIQGRFNPTDITIGSSTIADGGVRFYVTEGRVTKHQVPEDYFGSAGVAEVPGLQKALLQVGHGGYKHHFSMGRGHVADKVIEMLRQHEGYTIVDLRKVT